MSGASIRALPRAWGGRATRLLSLRQAFAPVPSTAAGAQRVFVCRAAAGGGTSHDGKGQGFGKKPASDADALIKGLSEVAKSEKRDLGQTTTVLGMEQTEDKFRSLDEKVNEYPCLRGFKAIGTGGDEFAASMVAAVESVVGGVPEGMVRIRPSSKGKYVAVDVGPVMVTSVEQVVAIYGAMKEDSRLKWFL